MKRLLFVAALLAMLIVASGAIGQGTYVRGGGGGTPYTPTLTLPDTAFVAVGRQMNVWYDEMALSMPGMTPSSWIAFADSGRAMDRSWRWDAVAARTQPLTIKPVDANGVIGAAATMIVQAVAADAGSGESRILFIGDSLFDGSSTLADSTTYASQIVSLVDSLSDVTDAGAGTIVTIGTQGADGFMNEGRGGYTTTRFTSANGADANYCNPFWDRTNGRVSFRYYLTDRGLTGPIDYGVIMLGWNDVAAWGSAIATTAQIAASMARMDTLVTLLKDPVRGFADCRVLVCTIPMGANSLGAWGISYGAAYSATAKSAWPYWQKNAEAWNKALIARYDDDGTYTDTRNQVDVIPVHLWVDREYGYQRVAVPTSARPSGTEYRHTNYLHPYYAGRDQEADAIYSHLRHNFAMPNPINLLSESELLGTWTKTGSPTWVGWAACTVADVDSAALQEWSFTDNTATYFTVDTAGLTMQSSNTISCYFQRPATGADKTTRVQFYVNLASGSDRFAQFAISDGSPSGVLVSWEHLYSGATYGGANADSSLAWHRCANTASGWRRISFSFSNLYDTTDQTGIAISNIRVYINDQTSSRTSLGVRAGGVQFEQGVRRPSVYVPKP